MLEIASGGGPTNINPASVTFSANPLFSARNPYPGWIASHLDFFDTEMIFFQLR
jgi:hypothetical protein